MEPGCSIPGIHPIGAYPYTQIDRPSSTAEDILIITEFDHYLTPLLGKGTSPSTETVRSMWRWWTRASIPFFSDIQDKFRVNFERNMNSTLVVVSFGLNGVYCNVRDGRRDGTHTELNGIWHSQSLLSLSPAVVNLLRLLLLCCYYSLLGRSSCVALRWLGLYCEFSSFCHYSLVVLNLHSTKLIRDFMAE